MEEINKLKCDIGFNDFLDLIKSEKKEIDAAIIITSTHKEKQIKLYGNDKDIVDLISFLNSGEVINTLIQACYELGENNE